MLDTTLLDPKKNSDFAKIYAKTAPLLLYVAGQLGIQGEEREDVAQHAYLKLLESGSTFTLDHAKAYLTRTVRTLVIDRSRRRAVRKTDTVEDWSLVPATPMWANDPEQAAAFGAVTEVLGNLAASGDADVLVWFYRDGLSIEQIKARTGSPTGTITAKLSRLRTRHADTVRDAVEGAIAALPTR